MAKVSIPQRTIDKAIHRYLEGGENADTLAKELKVSRASIFNWAARYKKQMLEQARRAELTPKELERQDKAELIAQIEQLKLENRQLRDRLVSMMLTTDPLLMNPETMRAAMPPRKIIK